MHWQNDATNFVDLSGQMFKLKNNQPIPTLLYLEYQITVKCLGISLWQGNKHTELVKGHKNGNFETFQSVGQVHAWVNTGSHGNDGFLQSS